MEKKCAMDTKDIINLLADIAEQIESVVGEKGAISTFRYAGKQLGKRMGAEHAGGTEETARQLVARFFHEKEFMDTVELNNQYATLTGCKIGQVLHERHHTIGAHTLCHFGFGLIDGVQESVTGKKIITLHVSSDVHSNGITCKESW